MVGGVRIKGILVFVVLAILGWAEVCPAADYRADMVREKEGQETKGKIYVTDRMIRIETEARGRKMITLIDREKEKVYLIRPQARMYLEKPYGTALALTLMTPEALAKIGRVEKLGQETIGGFKCDKIRVVYRNRQNGEALVWRSEKLAIPLKTVTKSSRGTVTTRCTNVEFTDLDEALFDLPTGYNRIAPRKAPANQTQ